MTILGQIFPGGGARSLPELVGVACIDGASATVLPGAEGILSVVRASKGVYEVTCAFRIEGVNLVPSELWCNCQLQSLVAEPTGLGWISVQRMSFTQLKVQTARLFQGALVVDDAVFWLAVYRYP